MSAAIPRLPQYAFMAGAQFKKSNMDNFTFTCTNLLCKKCSSAVYRFSLFNLAVQLLFNEVVETDIKAKVPAIVHHVAAMLTCNFAV
jgi:hypothetical protein